MYLCDINSHGLFHRAYFLFYRKIIQLLFGNITILQTQGRQVAFERMNSFLITGRKEAAETASFNHEQLMYT
jgi:hypothetical protein